MTEPATDQPAQVPDRELRETLIAHAMKVSVAIYIDTSTSVADDVSNTIRNLIARVRQEQRRAEAAEAVVEAARNVGAMDDGYPIGVDRLNEALDAYFVAKAAGFPGEGKGTFVEDRK